MLLADPGEFLPEDEIDERLRCRSNSLHLRRRLGIERDHEKMMFGRGAVSSYGIRLSTVSKLYNYRPQAYGVSTGWASATPRVSK